MPLFMHFKPGNGKNLQYKCKAYNPQKINNNMITESLIALILPIHTYKFLLEILLFKPKNSLYIV